MRRGLFMLLAILSLVLCVAAAAMWVRSYLIYDRYFRGFRHGNDAVRVITVDSSRGMLLVRMNSAGYPRPTPAGLHSIDEWWQVLERAPRLTHEPPFDLWRFTGGTRWIG